MLSRSDKPRASLERVPPSGLAVEVDGVRVVLPDAGFEDYLPAGFNYSGDRGWWSEATLGRCGEALILRTWKVHSHEGGDDRKPDRAWTSRDGGATWSPGAESDPADEVVLCTIAS